MICWYCYWGWPKQVADIFDRNAKILGDGHVLEYGPAHVVWCDENFYDSIIKSCMHEAAAKNALKYDLTPFQMGVVSGSLKSLLMVPESVRCCVPDNYDGEHPENYPPPVGLEMVKR